VIGMQEPDALRTEAIERLKKKREFSQHVVAYVLVNALLVVIWAISSAGFFWPVFPILGWGIGLTFHAWETFSRPNFTEERIRKEMDRLR
jgi:hypothetical protein